MKYTVKLNFEDFEFSSGMQALDFATTAARTSTENASCRIEVSAEDEDDKDDHTV